MEDETQQPLSAALFSCIFRSFNLNPVIDVRSR